MLKVKIKNLIFDNNNLENISLPSLILDFVSFVQILYKFKY